MIKLFENKLFETRLFGKKKALLFGLNYVSHDQGRLRGCVNDVQGMSNFLKSKGYVVELYHDEDMELISGTTYEGMVRAIQRLAIDTWRQNIESVVIHYSGHGSYVRDTNGDEKDGFDECLCPIDYNTCGVITDDFFYELISSFNPKTRITVILDCCHSGTALDLPYCYKTSSDYVVEQNKLKAHVTMISGCRDDQTSSDAYLGDKFSGALTNYLLSILNKNPNISPAMLLDNLHTCLSVAGFTQLPMISSTRKIKDVKLF
jgi:hypothetical protein